LYAALLCVRAGGSGHRLPKTEDPAPAFDYNGYLDFLAAHNHNFFRLWTWEAPKWTDGMKSPSSI
jgi:hypothetical protein